MIDSNARLCAVSSHSLDWVFILDIYKYLQYVERESLAQV
jgi:hypothetical protein